jgi:hypothetical protein
MKSETEFSVGTRIDEATLYETIGGIVMQFVSLEYSIIDTICMLMPSMDRALSVSLLAEDKFHTLLLKFKRIFLHQFKHKTLIKNKSLKNDFDAIFTELKKIEKQRNNFVHAIFFLIEGQGIKRYKLKPDIYSVDSFEILSMKQEDIDKFYERIMNAKKSLRTFTTNAVKLLPK